MPSIHSLIKRIPGPIKDAMKKVVYPELLPVGTTAPEWHLQNWDGSWVRMRQDRWVVMVFYPGDDTPGCTTQLCDLRDVHPDLSALNVEVVGINPADAGSHKRFAEKYSLPFPILIDENNRTAIAFRCTLPLPSGPRIIRTVYVIDPDRRIRLAERGMPSIETIRHSVQAV
jgi:peroxiredoxin Q/BCP